MLRISEKTKWSSEDSSTFPSSTLTSHSSDTDPSLSDGCYSDDGDSATQGQRRCPDCMNDGEYQCKKNVSLHIFLEQNVEKKLTEEQFHAAMLEKIAPASCQRRGEL
nr:unnamed protein product [Haemonchus contortus]